MLLFKVGSYVNDYKQFLGYRNTALLAIDDLGMESERIMKYGQECYPISELLPIAMSVGYSPL